MRADKSTLGKETLHKHDSAQAVFCAQISALVNVIQQKLPDLVKDQDTEVLHQYRVSLRKVEALLSVFNSFVPEKIRLQMKTDIKSLFSETGQVRDLDLLLHKAQLANPESKHTSGEAALIDGIAAKRQEEFEQFLLATKSSAYHERFVRLQNCLSQVEQHRTQVSLNDCWPVMLNQCMNNVHTAYKKLWKENDKLHIHKLRKKLKQLRYCVELLGVLVKPRKARKVLSWLKIQQENLGNYNDFQIEVSLLKGHGLANKKIRRTIVIGNVTHDRKSLPLLKSDWKTLRKKIKPLWNALV